MAERLDDSADEFQTKTGSPCDEIDLADVFESECNAEAENLYLDDRGSGSEEVDSTSEKEEHMDNELSDGFPYGLTPPRNVRRLKERVRKGKEKVEAFLKSSSNREFVIHAAEKAELDRRKKRGSTQLTNERAFQRKLKRGSVEIGCNPEGGFHLLESSKSLDIPSIKIESTSRFMSLDCVCEESTETSSNSIRKPVSRSHPKASRSESDPDKAYSKMHLSPHCPETRMEFYRTFSLLIKLGSLAHKQQEKQSSSGGALERQSSEENKRWQVLFSQALWLELQAWHANRTMEEQDLYLMQARTNVEEVLDKVMNFKVQVQSYELQDASVIQEQELETRYKSTFESKQNEKFQSLSYKSAGNIISECTEDGLLETTASIQSSTVSNTMERRTAKQGLSLDLNPGTDASCIKNKKVSEEGTCSKLKAAIEQVTALFEEIEAVEQLYPTRQSLGEQNEKYTSQEFTQKFETLSLWLNLTRELNHKLYLVAKFVGVDMCQADLWRDWIDAGLGRKDDLCPDSSISDGCTKDYDANDDDDDDDNDNNDYSDDDNEDSGNEENGTIELAENMPSSPIRTVSYEGQTSTPSRPSRTSSNMSNFVWSSTSRYRPFVDRSIKKMGLIKLGKRIGDILDSTIMKARRVLASPLDSCQADNCHCAIIRQLSVDYLDALLNGDSEAETQVSCSCHPHRSGSFDSESFDGRVWSDDFDKIGLPSFRPLYLFLSRIPLDISHECLRLRLQHRPKGEPSSLSVRQLLRECKEVLLGAVLVKDYYLSLLDGIADPDDLQKDSIDIEEFEQDLQSLLQVYFEYLHNVIHLVQRLPQASKGLKNILEEEWDFVKTRCRHVRGGEVEGGTRFCVMASGLLESTGDFLDSGLDQCCSDLHNNTDHGEDLRRKVLEACRGFKHLFNEARERASKALGFTKKLRNDLENAAMFSIDVPMSDLMTRLEITGHVQVVARHMTGLLMFVPKDLIQDECQIIHLLNACCIQEELGDQAIKDSRGYLLIMPSGCVNSSNEAPVWTGKKVVVNPTMDTAISLADIQVGGMIMVVHSSKQLDIQRRLFFDSMSLSASVVKQRTSSQQNIAETLDDLQDACLSLREGIASAIERVDQNLDLDTMFDMDEAEKAMVYQTYTETMHLCYHFGFEYQKEVARLVFEERRKNLGCKLLSFARQWMKFVMTKCERGRGTRPRWANQGLDFLTVACDPKTLTTLSETEFKELKKEINNCISHVIGSADSSGVTSPGYRSQSPACPSPVFGRGTAPSLLRPSSWPASKPTKVPGDQGNGTDDSGQNTQRHLSDPSKSQFQSLATDVPNNNNGTTSVSKEEGDEETVKHKDSFTTAPDIPWLEKVRHSLKKLEEKRNEYLKEKRVIGRVSSRQRDIVKEFTSIASRKVPFKWQRGNKIGEGQFGKVYACVNLDTGEMMAVKQIKFQPNDQSEKRDLADEIKMFEGIRHESLVRYYGVELHRDEMFIFMEYCADGTISDVAKLGLPESMIRVYTYQILVAVNVLHERGIVHRDVKGANIFLSSDGLIKLGDFGSSIKLKNPFQTTYGEISNIRGTVAYMAPEVITLDKGAGYGRAADIWSVGCVVVEMATGKPPWPECDNNFVIMFKVGEGATPAIPESLSEEGQDFLLCCFLHDPYERQTASELMDHPFVKCC